MQFNNHSKLSGLHASFSPSKSSWLRYDDDKVIDFYGNLRAKEMGTILHAWAKQTIDLGLKQPRSKKTICAYVNDAIGYKMDTEVVLFYSERFFGTADAISFRDGVLRIHDLKTGKTPVNMEQLEIYTALFCLEYRVDPRDIEMELRIYQNDMVIVHKPTPEDIHEIINKIVHIDNLLEKLESKEV